MGKRQFDIRTLLALTVVVCFALRFLTLEGSFAFRFFVTLTMMTFVCAVLALIWYVAVPLFGKD